MAVTTTIPPTPAPEDIVQYADSHRVSLQAGDYRLEAKQILKSSNPASLPEEIWTAQTQFSVLGNRYELSPNLVRSAYPPAGSRGNFWHTMPHIVLERSSIPWERTAEIGGVKPAVDAPWLALLVFHPGDPIPQTKTMRWADFRQSAGLKAEAAETPSDLVKVITLPSPLAKALLPGLPEIQQLNHVRRRLAFLKSFNALADAEDFIKSQLPDSKVNEITGNDLPENMAKAWLWRSVTTADSFEILQEKGANAPFKCYSVAHEAATVIANRLPMPGGRNEVHLVSVERRYNSSTFDPGQAAEVSFISLYHWDFYTTNEEQSFKGLLENLNKDTGNNEWPTAWGIPLPAGVGADTAAGKALRAGWMALRHRFRDGSRSVSWYRGPLTPIEPDTALLANVWGQGDDTLSVRHADQLMLYNIEHGMYDVSYAAAWELGRLLTLQNTRIALDLLHWKRQHAHELHAVRHLAEYGYHLPVTAKTYSIDPDESRKANIWNWLDELTLLKHIPFNYLIPKPELLPNESIHFFTVDRRWVECLRDGAFSIGRVLERDSAHDDHLAATSPFAEELPAEGGLLLRSQLVSGWPDMIITGYKKREAPVKGMLPDPNHDDVLVPVRTEKLAPNVLLVLFPGRVEAVDFYLPPETLHFGLDIPETGTINDQQPEKLVKRIRDKQTGKENSAEVQLTKTKHFKDYARRILHIQNLAQDLVGGQEQLAGAVALQLTAGTPLVRIIRPQS